MAPVMVLSSISQSCMQTAYQCAKVAPTTASSMQGARRIKPVSNSNYNLLSEDKSLQSQFSSEALHSRREWRRISAVRSTRAELAPDADKGNVIEVKDSETMEKYIAESGDKLVVVDVSTRTCGPCKLIFPKVVKMSKEYPKALFLKINGDLNNDTRALMRKWGVNSVPSFRFFRNGKQIHSHVGAKEDDLRAHFLVHYVKTLNVTA
jgi:thioredoxin 1